MEKIHFVVRAFIEDGNYVLVADAGTHLFLPGGHVKRGECAQSSLRRELEEEIGIKHLKIEGFVGLIENTWYDKATPIHENLIIFKASSDELDKNKIVTSHEQHLKFHWIKFEELKDLNFLPKAMLNFLEFYKKNEKPNFLSLMNN